MKKTKFVCSYCNEVPEILPSIKFYGRDYGTYVYLCRPCGAYVGTHKGTTTPLGTLANAELRELRKIAHAEFDPLWKNRVMSRSKAYKELSIFMRVPKKEAHIGMFTKEQCQKLIKHLVEARRGQTVY